MNQILQLVLAAGLIMSPSSGNANIFAHLGTVGKGTVGKGTVGKGMVGEAGCLAVVTGAQEVAIDADCVTQNWRRPEEVDWFTFSFSRFRRPDCQLMELISVDVGVVRARTYCVFDSFVEHWRIFGWEG